MRNLVQVCVHFVWATWDRQPLITEEVGRNLYRYIQSVCDDDRCSVLALGGMPDHVHLLVCMSSTASLAQFMQHVKGGSSRFFSETLKPGSWFAWQGSYGAFAVSLRDRKKIIAYIGNQKQHHADGTLWPNAERTSEIVSTKVETRP